MTFMKFTRMPRFEKPFDQTIKSKTVHFWKLPGTVENYEGTPNLKVTPN